MLPMSLDRAFTLLGFVSLKDEAGVSPPEHLPDDISLAFREGATCCVVKCWNAAAGAMFRLCIDLATKARLPPVGETDIKGHERGKLALRLRWMFANGVLPKDLEGLSQCIREDGNDGRRAVQQS